jgi:hypothetical protein
VGTPAPLDGFYPGDVKTPIVATMSARAQWVVALIAIVLAFAFLGSRGLWDPDEGRYTNVAANMVASGDWLVPHRNHDVGHWTKPPLTYWAIAASFSVFGMNTVGGAHTGGAGLSVLRVVRDAHCAQDGAGARGLRFTRVRDDARACAGRRSWSPRTSCSRRGRRSRCGPMSSSDGATASCSGTC